MKRHNGRRATLALIIAAGTLHQGCLGRGSKGDCGAPGLGSCPMPSSSRPERGTREDGRVDVTAGEAWPDRAPEPARLTPDEVANACAAQAICLWGSGADGGGVASDPYAGAFVDAAFGLCLEGRSSSDLFALDAQDSLIPMRGKVEDFTFFSRQVLAAGGDCSAIRGILTDAPGLLSCWTNGCYSTALQEVSCEGDVAVFGDGTRRDCSRAHAHCSEDSETGCTDRLLTRCEKGAKGRCDGDVLLACDDCGFVQLRDCAFAGGHCQETEEGAECVAPDATACVGMNGACQGDGFDVCAFGGRAHVDCAALGLKCMDRQIGPLGADDSSANDACHRAGLEAPCVLGSCVPAAAIPADGERGAH